MTPIADYYIIGGVVYQAPDLGSVLNSRLLTTVNHLQTAFDEARYVMKQAYSLAKNLSIFHQGLLPVPPFPRVLVGL